MKKNDLLQCGDIILRVLEVKNNDVFVIDCRKRTIPTWMPLSDMQEYKLIADSELYRCLSFPLPDIDTLDAKSRRIMNKRFTMISEILPFVSDFRKRNKLLSAISSEICLLAMQQIQI